MEFKFELREKEVKFLKQYAELFSEERRKDITSDPIVVVEELEYIPTDSNYSFDKTIFLIDDEGDCCEMDTVNDVIDTLRDWGENEDSLENIREELEFSGECSIASGGNVSTVHVLERYKPAAFFLTRKEADDYVKYQSHNLRSPRVYTHNMGYANGGDLKCLAEMMLRMGDNLNKMND